MISPHAQALYDRLTRGNRGMDGGSVLPEAALPEKKSSEEEKIEGGDLAPSPISKEISFDEGTSDMPQSLQGMDQGQLAKHPGAQPIDKLASAGKPQLPDISQILLDSHHQSHPGTMGQKVNARVQASMPKTKP